MADPRPAISFPDPLAAVFDRAMTAALAQVPPLPRFQSRCRLISAVSGGPDSIALALHSQRFAVAHGGTHRSIVIDHGIRPGSDAEAARVVSRLEAHGISASCIRIQTPAPSTGIQEWARARRYEHLLAEARRDRACLLVGQHAGDQAETVMMRLAHGSGLAGLAGMRPVTMRGGVPVIRPLLDASRAAIIASCDQHAITTEADPSNNDRRFERVRRRAEIAAMDATGMQVTSGLLRLAKAASAVDRALLRQFGSAGIPLAPEAAGHLVLPIAALQMPPLVLARLLAGVIGMVAIPGHAPGSDALARLSKRLHDNKPSTLGSARFTPQQGGWLVTAEIGRQPPRCKVSAGEEALFAGSWLITSPVDAMIRYLGEAGSGSKGGWQESRGWSVIPPLARRSLPVLETLDGAVLYPHLISHDQPVARGVTAQAECLRHTNAPDAVGIDGQQSFSRRRLCT